MTRLVVVIGEKSRETTELERSRNEALVELDKARFAIYEKDATIAEQAATIAKLAEALKKSEKAKEEMRVKLGDPNANADNSGLPPSKSFGRKSKKTKAETEDEPDNETGQGPENKAEGGPETETGKDPEAKKQKKKGKPGAKKGHEPNFRTPFTEDEIDETREYEPESTSCCGGVMERFKEGDTVTQQIELPEKPVHKTEHRAAAYICPKCGKIHKGTIPDQYGKLFGPRLVAVLVALKLDCKGSYRGIQDFFLNTLGLAISTGYLSKMFNGASKCFEPAYKEIEEEIPKQPVLFVDETTHKENGKRLYTWVFRAVALVLFVIGDRSRTIIDTVLTTAWNGILCCDYYGVYLSFANEAAGVKLQHCLAHLAREFKRCADHTLDPEIQAYGEKMSALLKELFEARDAFNENPNPETLGVFRRCADAFNAEAANAPPKGRPQKLAKRFQNKGNTYTTFVDAPGVPGTNNPAEHSIRYVVVMRNVTQGTRGAKGRKASEIYWSVRGTCKLQGRSFHQFFLDSYTAFIKKEKGPSILPPTE